MRQQMAVEPEFSESAEFDWEYDVGGAVLVVQLQSVKIRGYSETPLQLTSSGKYEGFYTIPVTGPTSSIVVTGRLMVDDATGRRPYDSKIDGKTWPLSGAAAWSNVNVVNNNGPANGSAFHNKVQPDGSFVTTTSLTIGGESRELTFTSIVEIKGGKRFGATAHLELIDLQGFLAIVDPKEQSRSSSQSHLEFLASVRKVFQGGPNDPLAGLFDMVLYRNRRVGPVFGSGSADEKRLLQYAELYAGGARLDIGHVLTGIEGARKQDPNQNQNIPIPIRPDLKVTWAGDLGSGLQHYITDFLKAVDQGDPVNILTHLRARAGLLDLIGDIDGVNIGAAYDANKSLADNLNRYYANAANRRYRDFIANSLDDSGKPAIPLTPGTKLPRISDQGKKWIALQVRNYLVPFWLTGRLDNNDASKKDLVTGIIAVDSVEMDQVVSYFVGFLEYGLAMEARSAAVVHELDLDLEGEFETPGDSIPDSIRQSATQLGADWSKRRGGTPAPDPMTAWLLSDYQDTVEGAQARYGKKLSVASIGKAWLESRQQNMNFQLGFSNLPMMKNFAPPAAKETLIDSKYVQQDPRPAPVAPLMDKFAKELLRIFPKVNIGNYPRHGGGAFFGRGYSVDLQPDVPKLDSRGFYPQDLAIKLIRAVHSAATAVGAQWRILYNDYEVARVVNRALGAQHIAFIGVPNKRQNGKITNITWHGPSPLILHLHLDIAPLVGSPSTWKDASQSELPAPLQLTGGGLQGAQNRPAPANQFRKFRLTNYLVADQQDYPATTVTPVFTDSGNKLASVSPEFFANMALEGTGRLTGGILLNVTGKWVKVAHSDYADVLAYHQRYLPKRPTAYSGITVANGQVVSALAFGVVPKARVGIGYGITHGVPLVPFRTLAADIGAMKGSEPKWKGKGGVVPLNTRVFISEFNGMKLPDGTTHDGWFTVNDTGGAINGVHFDVFVGTRALGKKIKFPSFGQVWFSGIDARIPSNYTYGLS